MSSTVAKQAAQTTQEIAALPANALPPEEPLPLDAAPAQAEAIRTRMAQIDLTDTQSIIGFGSSAQTELQGISQQMLADVKNKEIGPAGDSLRQMVTTIRGFSVSELDVRRKKSWWESLTGRAAPFANFVARYERVQDQIDKITETLLGHEHKLLKDVKSLDILYDRTLEFYNELAIYIAAGEAKLREVDQTDIPTREAQLATLPETEQVMGAQSLRDLRAARDDLERRVHDLKLTRQVTMQSLPSIRLVQENDKSLVTKINSTLVNTVPLWETQLAQAVTVQRSREAAESIRAANDLTNELLTKNADNLQESNRIVRQEMERGVFDVESIRQANTTLISTINESLQIADEGKARRAAAEEDLKKMEAELRETLAAASARRALGDEMKKGGIFRATSVALLLAGCAAEVAPVAPPMRPKSRPEGLAMPRPPSAESEGLRVYYAAVQSDQLASGLLRTDGGGADTPFTDRMLAENFIRIALYDEYSRGKDGFVQGEVPSRLRRWGGPVRVGITFGASMPEEKRGIEKARIGSYLARLSRLTGHPISLSDGAANFHLYILNEDERRAMGPEFARALPQLSQAEIGGVTGLARSTYCLVYAMSPGDSSTYSGAFALIRSEHPDLLRTACLHEEIAQGLGLANDHPQARPSIFNDDEEFALLTVMDEYMLRILYDPRLKPGMTEAEARPIVEQIATELVGGSS